MQFFFVYIFHLEINNPSMSRSKVFAYHIWVLQPTCMLLCLILRHFQETDIVGSNGERGVLPIIFGGQSKPSPINTFVVNHPFSIIFPGANHPSPTSLFGPTIQLQIFWGPTIHLPSFLYQSSPIRFLQLTFHQFLGQPPISHQLFWPFIPHQFFTTNLP